MSSFVPHTVRLRPALATLDVLLLGAAGYLAHLIRFAPADRVKALAVLWSTPSLILLGVVALWCLAEATELYEPLLLRRRREIVIRTAVVAAAWSLGLAAGTYLVPTWAFGRGLLVLTTAGWFLGAWAMRVTVARWLRSRPRPPALVVGEPAAVASVCAVLSRNPYAPWEPVNGAGVRPSAIRAAVAREGAGLVIVAGGDDRAEQTETLAALHFSTVPVIVGSEAWAWLEGRLPVSQLSPAAFLHQPGFGAVHWSLFNRLTRVIDVALSSLLVVLSAPLLALAALAILILDGRPVLYVQERLGQFGRPFRLIKLRTMHPDAEANGAAFAAADDPRVTAVGRVLRRFRLDEMPQLLNVLRGDMSLVGPRPERAEHVEALALAIPYYNFRLALPPGLTGWAQVNMGYAGTLEEHRHKLEYDLYFIRERSVALYVITLLRTLAVALAGARPTGIERRPDAAPAPAAPPSQGAATVAPSTRDEEIALIAK